MIGPVKVHVDNKGIIDGLWRGERERPICGSRSGKNCTFRSQEIFWMEVEHVKAHRTKKDKKDMSHLSNVGRRVHGGSESKNGAARERSSVCSPAVRSQVSLFGGRMETL